MNCCVHTRLWRPLLHRLHGKIWWREDQIFPWGREYDLSPRFVSQHHSERLKIFSVQRFSTPTHSLLSFRLCSQISFPVTPDPLTFCHGRQCLQPLHTCKHCHSWYYFKVLKNPQTQPYGVCFSRLPLLPTAASRKPHPSPCAPGVNTTLRERKGGEGRAEEMGAWRTRVIK